MEMTMRLTDIQWVIRRKMDDWNVWPTMQGDYNDKDIKATKPDRNI